MKRVTLKAVVDKDLCVGCRICEKVCPVYAISVVDRKATVQDDKKCRGCANCADRCPRYAIKMVERDDPFDVGVDVSKVDYSKIRALCEKAHVNPEQVLCYCVGVRAEEAAARESMVNIRLMAINALSTMVKRFIKAMIFPTAVTPPLTR